MLATEPRHLSLADGARHAECTPCSDALVIAAGSPKEDEISFPKSLALHAALFQLELHDVILAFCHDKVAMRVSHTEHTRLSWQARVECVRWDRSRSLPPFDDLFRVRSVCPFVLWFWFCWCSLRVPFDNPVHVHIR